MTTRQLYLALRECDQITSSVHNIKNYLKDDFKDNYYGDPCDDFLDDVEDTLDEIREDIAFVNSELAQLWRNRGFDRSDLYKEVF